MNYRYLRAFLLVSLGLVLVSCSITRVKWRIKWDKGMEESKAAFMEAPLPAEKERQPNIILLVADDLGPYEVSAYGVEHISTPNIDQIGKDGVVFEAGYATAFFGKGHLGDIEESYLHNQGFDEALSTPMNKITSLYNPQGNAVLGLFPDIYPPDPYRLDNPGLNPEGWVMNVEGKKRGAWT